MACCVRGYHVYKDIEAAATRKVLGAVRSQPMSENLELFRVKYFRTFSVYENIFTTKIKQITVYDG